MYEGKERETCNEAHIIFGYSQICGWAKRYEENSGYCGHIYYLTSNGFLFFSFLFLFFVSSIDLVLIYFTYLSILL
jgi:hypothetical protein